MLGMWVAQAFEHERHHDSYHKGNVHKETYVYHGEYKGKKYAAIKSI